MRAEPPTEAHRDLERLVRRLRGFSPRAWSVAGRREAVQRLLRDLAALGAPGRELPDLPDHALGDATAVLAYDAMQKGRHDAVAAALRQALEATR